MASRDDRGDRSICAYSFEPEYDDVEVRGSALVEGESDPLLVDALVKVGNSLLIAPSRNQGGTDSLGQMRLLCSNDKVT